MTYAKGSLQKRDLWEGIKGQEGRYPSSQPGGERGVEIGYGRKGGGGPQKQTAATSGDPRTGVGRGQLQSVGSLSSGAECSHSCYMVHKESAGVRGDSGHPTTHRAAPQLQA